MPSKPIDSAMRAICLAPADFAWCNMRRYGIEVLIIGKVVGGLKLVGWRNSQVHF
jgi:hypothetical protein